MSEVTGTKDQLELIYAGEIKRLYNKMPKSPLTEKEVRRLVELTKGFKELEAIPDKRILSKEIEGKTDDELREIIRGGATSQGT